MIGYTSSPVFSMMVVALLLHASAANNNYPEPESNMQVDYDANANTDGIPEYHGVVKEAAAYEPEHAEKATYETAAAAAPCPVYGTAAAADTEDYNAYRRSRNLNDYDCDLFDEIKPSEYNPPGNDGKPSSVTAFWASFFLVGWCVFGCCGYWCFLRAVRRGSAALKFVKAHDTMLHDINNAIQSDDTEKWVVDDTIPSSPRRNRYGGGDLSPASPLNKFVYNVKTHDQNKQKALQQQRVADAEGGLGRGDGDRFGRGDVLPDIKDTVYSDNSSLNKLAANDDMTLQVGTNEQWGATLNFQ